MSDPSDLLMTRGINYPAVGWQGLESIEPDVIFDLTGKTIYLKISKGPYTLIEKNSGDSPSDFAIDIAEGTVTWTPTIDETLLLPLGRIAKYRVEWRNGTEQGLFAKGYVNVANGPDVE